MLIDLLKVRYQGIVSIALSNSSSDHKMGKMDKIKAFGRMVGLGGKIKMTTNFHLLNPETKEDVLSQLRAAVELRNALELLGQRVELDGKLDSVLQHLVIPRESGFDVPNCSLILSLCLPTLQ